MAKKSRKLTDQESLVTTFAKHSISSRTAFHPDQWASGTEPADMIIVVGRAMLFFNMTAGKSYFDNLVAHNIDQARDRLAEWQGGRQIRGKNEWGAFAIDWTDIDSIHVVSVIDGPHAACMDHPLNDLDLPEKVRLCTSITSKALHQLAVRGGGARDLIGVCQSMRPGAKISEQSAVRFIRNRYNEILYMCLEEVKAEPKRFGRAIISGREVSSFEEYRHSFEAMRRQTFENSSFDVFSDLAWVDIFPAIAFITSSIAEMEYAPDGQIRTCIFGGMTRFQVVISSSFEGLLANMKQVHDAGLNDGALFSQTIMLTGIGPMTTIAVQPNIVPPSTEADVRIPRVQ